MLSSLSIKKVSNDLQSLHNMSVAQLILTTITKGGLFLILQDLCGGLQAFSALSKGGGGGGVNKNHLYLSKFCLPNPSVLYDCPSQGMFYSITEIHYIWVVYSNSGYIRHYGPNSLLLCCDIGNRSTYPVAY